MKDILLTCYLIWIYLNTKILLLFEQRDINCMVKYGISDGVNFLYKVVIPKETTVLNTLEEVKSLYCVGYSLNQENCSLSNLLPFFYVNWWIFLLKWDLIIQLFPPNSFLQVENVWPQFGTCKTSNWQLYLIVFK